VLKMIARAAGLALALGAAPGAAQAMSGDVAACRGGGDGILVTVDGFRARTGNIRVALYNNAATFLERGHTLRKIDVPVPRGGAMRICIAPPGPGRYAVAVRHDLDGNGRSGWNDGAGFSRNPDISLARLRPRFDNVAIAAGRGVTPVRVVLNYRYGLSIRPVAG